MKIMFCLLLILLISVVPVSAENYIVISDDERIISAKDEHEQRSIASITKIMTAMVCLEYGDYIDVWTVGDEVYTADEKRIYLVEGQEVSMRSLLYGLMLESGNDAAIVLAKRVGGSVERFVEMMNKKAKEIGMLNTEFNNPHGLDIHEKGNLSTCYDMALLMKYALNNQVFCEIIGTVEYHAEWGSIFHNSNKLLNDFPFCLGGKTGYTSKAGRTLVTASRNNDLTLICTTFNLQDNFAFHKNQYISAFNTYKKQVIVDAKKYWWRDRIIDVDEPFTVTCTNEELSRAEIRHWYDESSGDFTVQFRLDDYLVSKTYSTSAYKKFCVMGWCL